eukprot:TRINITY_DN1040_c0_g1_i2.p1 TRINITY_DN1040_c0_g1~~TRINITY_DN1040_c0_g1_i2.p1  ORF type:complete len:134 (-),score=31.82 TRINITY_DN1040_c0_g1_i2:38-439(-)
MVQSSANADTTAAIKQLDVDKDGKISFEELHQWWIQLYCPKQINKKEVAKKKSKGVDTKKEAEALFTFYDKDKSGSLDHAEFTAFLKELSSSLGLVSPSAKDITDAIALVDANKDGSIAFAEFFAWWNTMYGS